MLMSLTTLSRSTEASDWLLHEGSHSWLVQKADNMKKQESPHSQESDQRWSWLEDSRKRRSGENIISLTNAVTWLVTCDRHQEPDSGTSWRSWLLYQQTISWAGPNCHFQPQILNLSVTFLDFWAHLIKAGLRKMLIVKWQIISRWQVPL